MTTPKMKPVRGNIRPIIETVRPEINGGRYAIKRVLGDLLQIEATVILDGHDLLSCRLLYRHESHKDWTQVPMRLIQQGRDLWAAGFEATQPGTYFYTVEASVDRFATWRSEIEKKHAAGQEIVLELQEGAGLLRDVLKRGRKEIPTAEQMRIHLALETLEDRLVTQTKKVRQLVHSDLLALLERYPDPAASIRYPRELRAFVDREKAVFSAWYEFFPRSTSGSPGIHGTFRTSEAMLPYIAKMGFDVVYLPPIHPIGFAFRKGKNNSLDPSPADPGSPWGIGASTGGHKSVHPELGSLKDFQRFLKKAKQYKLEIALDIAFQCSPDHPYVRKHPEWFRRRPDGSIQYAENPPKKYQDIYPFNFETPGKKDWSGLWNELKSVVDFWISQGVKIFRVDNPHTKPVAFWEWLIASVQAKHPEVIFLSEAFTRPSMMYLLAKAGFTQSYTYFTWRNTSQEFRKYMEELTRSEIREYYRPSFWPNTPDILPTHLQTGGRTAFLARAALAATLSSTYGIYGPAYELCINTPFKPGGEEYLDSEKYEIKAWNLAAKDSLQHFLSALNHIRKENPALHRNHSLRFLEIDNEKIVAFAKTSDDLSNIIVVAVSLDFKKTQAGTLTLPLEAFGLDPHKSYTVTELLGRFSADSSGSKRRIRLNPSINPVTILRIEK